MSDAQNLSTEPLGDENSSPNLSLPPDLLEDIPEEKRAELIQLVSQIEVYGSFSGPLPPPNVLNLYDSDTRQTIVAEFVANRVHRTKSQSRRQILHFVWDMLTLGAAFVLAWRLIDGSITIIQQGQSAEGLLGIGGTVAAVVTAFLFRDRQRRKDSEAQHTAPSTTDLLQGDEDSS